MISVFILTGPDRDQTFQFENDVAFVGRSEENDIQLRDRNVSRNHLKIVREQEKYFIMDLGSKNGTYIDSKHIAPNSKIRITEEIPILIGMTVLCLGQGCKAHLQHYFDMVEIPESDEKLLQHSVLHYQQNIDMLNKLSGILTSSPTLGEMTEKILEIIFQISPEINRAALILLDPETGDITDTVSKTSPSSDDSGFSYDLDVVSHVLKTEKPFQFRDAVDEHNDGISETLKVSKIRSVLCLPLSDGSGIIGVIYIDSVEKPNGFQKEDIYLMNLLGEKVGPRLAEFSNLIHGQDSSLLV